MKWIGQHIWDFISRFRSDIYMEAIESGTIASGGNLGLDSNMKVVKASDPIAVTNAVNSEHVAVVDNESEDEDNLIPFIENGSATGMVGLESDGDLNYNPSTGTLSAPVFRVTKNKIVLPQAVIGDVGYGDIVYFGGTTSMVAGHVYYLRTTGSWALADSDSASTSTGLLAVALGAASDTDGMLIRGTVTLATDPGDVGEILYVSTTSGRLQNSAPSGSGDIVRVAGYKLRNTDGWNDDSEAQVWFNPDSAWVEIA